MTNKLKVVQLPHIVSQHRDCVEIVIWRWMDNLKEFLATTHLTIDIL